jgi:uncharacterized protein (DUF2141 family)
VKRFAATVAIAFAAVIPGANAALTAMAASLRVAVDGISPAGGNLIVAIYDEATFPLAPDMPLFSRTIANARGTATAVFDRLPPGTYAVRVLDDVNHNGRADTGERSVLSNAAAAGDFDAASIVLHPGENSLAIHLH